MADRMTWWAYDMEAEDWVHFVVACAVSANGDRLVFRSEEEVVSWYRSLDKRDLVWAHNGGAYDWLHLISRSAELHWTARMAGSTIVSAKARGHAELRDTTRLFPGSLAKWTGRKEALGLPCVCERSCGGYCSIKREGMPREHMRRLIEYNLNDCDILLETLTADVDRLCDEGLVARSERAGEPRLTLGGIAWHSAAEIAGLPQYTIDWHEYDAGRSAYYGGRCEVYRVAASGPGRGWDVNAMYPWALLGPVPHGAMRSLLYDDASAAYRAGRPGAYHARVTVDPCRVPPLPYRHTGRSADPVMVRSSKAKSGRARVARITDERLVWCTGELEGWWTHIELAAAEQYGARIRSVDMAHVWSDYSPIYAPYIELIYSARERAIRSGDERWASILKWYANSLSGKLAQHPDVSTIEITDEPSIGMDRLSEDGNLWCRTSRRLTPNCQPIQAAYLTARARSEKLLPSLVEHAEWLLYTDTDSLKSLRSEISAEVHSTKLGAWKDEGPIVDWLCLGPKLYRHRDDAGNETVKARGIPRPTWDTLDRLAAGECVSREGGVERLRTSAGRDGRMGFRRRTVTRSHRDLGTGRCGTRHVEPDGRTRPVHRTWDGAYV